MSIVQISTQFKINPLCHLAKKFRSDCGFTGISNKVREEVDGMMETQALETLPVSFFLGPDYRSEIRGSIQPVVDVSGTVIETGKNKGHKTYRPFWIHSLQYLI